MPMPYELTYRRSNTEIVRDTNRLARMLTRQNGHEKPDGFRFHVATDPIGSAAWRHACEIMRLVTGADPEEAFLKLRGGK